MDMVLCTHGHVNQPSQTVCATCQAPLLSPTPSHHSPPNPGSFDAPPRSRPKWLIPVLVGGAVAVAIALGVSNSASSGPSESYLWGQKAGNSAVSLAQSGMQLNEACNAMIVSGAMFADDPILNQTPPPKNFNRADAQQGCMDQLHKRLGY